MNFLGEAFKRLNTLQEDTFDITDTDIAELEDVVVGTDEDETIDIIDDEVETFEELQPSYVGKVILDCNVCHSLVYKDKADVVLSDDGESANLSDECPYCMSTDGFKIVGEVAPFAEETEEEIEVKVDDEPVEVEEAEEDDDLEEGYRRIRRKALRESKNKNRSKSLKEDVDWSLRLDKNDQIVTNILKAVNKSSAVSKYFKIKHTGIDMDSSKKPYHYIILAPSAHLDDEDLLKDQIKESIMYAVDPDNIDVKIHPHFDDLLQVDLITNFNALGEGCESVSLKESVDEYDLEYYLDYGDYEYKNFHDDTIECYSSEDAQALSKDLEDDMGILCQIDPNNPNSIKIISEIIREAIEKCPNCGKDKKHCNCEKELEECGNPIIQEDLQDITITTEDQHLEMSSDENGKVTITTEPVEHENASEEEMIVPVDDELEAEIEATPEDEEALVDGEEFEDEFVADENGDVEVDLEDIDEESLDDVTESYLREVYENVASFKTTGITQKGNTLKVEGVINFKSGKERKTSFLFEAKQITKRGKVKLVGMNESITRGKKPYTLTGTISNKHLVVESFNYNYRQKDENGNSIRLYNTCKRSK